MPSTARDIQRRKFTSAVERKGLKIQVGARGQKNGPDWTAIDLFDTSDLIDHNWDLLDLPVEDQSVGCFVCNAVLEHVYEPQLAIFEMYRTLELGGHIWVEVPFNQFYHAHPFDFRRWTVEGLQWEMRRFDEVASGVSGVITNEVVKIANAFRMEGKLDISQEKIDEVVATTERYVENATRPRLYSGTFFWGVKKSHAISNVEREYMLKLREDVAKKMPNKAVRDAAGTRPVVEAARS
jgi:predicted SAM-dependent methyltransferase